ncbi:fumarylacetoacetate hydrolase family protein [Natronolimnobius sp. AArcel1]|uniref:fumarylacetoacetate hydrolase family protein n=1 Tax=Natronolimnobius sp. AArcel1 TaxID=1679093 RepID=UPI0013EC2E6C|nr:fumarylacetoacetate hydrolase family protein [Natronolimnobius sp. AArcel1]NGM71297.1 fumarylacetoacetate hydrolase family protein [Natronolimnobius sp. AArcel1]
MVRLARSAGGAPLLGDDTGYVPLSAADPSLTSICDALPRAASGTLPDPGKATAEPIPASDISFASPLGKYGKLWGIGLNYAEHASDLDEDRPTEPASFMKPKTAVTGPGGPIRLPEREISDRVTAEGELAVVIGRTCGNVAKDDAESVIAGYVPVIDMTAEDILEKNPRYLTRSKGFDSFIVFGSSILTTDEVRNLESVTVQTIVNGEVKAENQVRNMMTPPRELVSFHSNIMTFEPGDIISTGTPGASPIDAGDHVTADVEVVGDVSADVVR